MSATPFGSTERDETLQALASARGSDRVRELIRGLSDRYWKPVSIIYSSALGLSQTEADVRARNLLRSLAGSEPDLACLRQARGSLRCYILLRAGEELASPPGGDVRGLYRRAWIRCLLEDALEAMSEDLRLQGSLEAHGWFERWHLVADRGGSPEPRLLARGREAFWHAFEVVLLATLESEEVLVDEVAELFSV